MNLSKEIKFLISNELYLDEIKKTPILSKKYKFFPKNKRKTNIYKYNNDEKENDNIIKGFKKTIKNFDDIIINDSIDDEKNKDKKENIYDSIIIDKNNKNNLNNPNNNFLRNNSYFIQSKSILKIKKKPRSTSNTRKKVSFKQKVKVIMVAKYLNKRHKK